MWWQSGIRKSHVINFYMLLDIILSCFSDSGGRVVVYQSDISYYYKEMVIYTIKSKVCTDFTQKQTKMAFIKEKRWPLL